MDQPYLNLISPSIKSQEAMIIIRGYLSEDTFSADRKALWINWLRQSGWQGSIYYLWWEASSDSSWNVGRLQIRWQQVKSRAKRVGREHLTELLSRIPEKKVSFMAHSLGVRIIYYGLASEAGTTKILNHAIFLGGAVRRNKDWKGKASRLTGKIVNIYNSDDEVLNTWFKLGEIYFKSPCGIKPIKDTHPRIVNWDATTLINSDHHDEKHYLQVLPKIAAQERLW